MAERSGLPQSSMSQVETGRHLPSVATLARLAVALGLAWRLDVTPRGARILAEPAERAVTGNGGGAGPGSTRRSERDAAPPPAHPQRPGTPG